MPARLRSKSVRLARPRVSRMSARWCGERGRLRRESERRERLLSRRRAIEGPPWSELRPSERWRREREAASEAATRAHSGQEKSTAVIVMSRRVRVVLEARAGARAARPRFGDGKGVVHGEVERVAREVERDEAGSGVESKTGKKRSNEGTGEVAATESQVGEAETQKRSERGERLRAPNEQRSERGQRVENLLETRLRKVALVGVALVVLLQLAQTRKSGKQADVGRLGEASLNKSTFVTPPCIWSSSEP